MDTLVFINVASIERETSSNTGVFFSAAEAHQHAVDAGGKYQPDQYVEVWRNGNRLGDHLISCMGTVRIPLEEFITLLSKTPFGEPALLGRPGDPRQNAIDDAAGVIERCICDRGPDTDGPDIDCAQHGDQHARAHGAAHALAVRCIR